MEKLISIESGKTMKKASGFPVGRSGWVSWEQGSVKVSVFAN